MVTARQLTQRQQQLAFNNSIQSITYENNNPSFGNNPPSTWDAFTSGTTSDQKAFAGSAAMSSFPVNVLLSGRGTYTTAEMTANTNLGGSQGSGLPFAPYTVGAAPNKLGQENQNLLFGGNTAMSGLTNNQQNREAATDLGLVKVGEELNMFASSPGSPSDNARLAGIEATTDFFRQTSKYGSEVRVGGAGNPNAGGNFPAKAPMTTGAQPLDWNKDANGNPLPWGTRREADGKVYSTSGGGDNFANTSFFTGEVPGGNLVSVLAVPTASLKNIITSPVFHTGPTKGQQKRSFYNF